MEKELANDFDVLTEVIASLKRLGKEDQKRTLQAVATFLNLSFHGSPISATNLSSPVPIIHSSGKPTFSENRAVSPKDFVREKSPRTDVERVICLAYYLTHYRETPHFKTLDISALNTEAAQPKFSSASVAVENAARAGLLVQAVKGNKQISAAGELYVQHLPDRDAAKLGVQGIRPKRRQRKAPAKKTSGNRL
jgi:hypothetical protein